jgi:hypothetical protein
MKIDELLILPEGKTLEFKRDLSSPKPVLRTLVAFANTADFDLDQDALKLWFAGRDRTLNISALESLGILAHQGSVSVVSNGGWHDSGKLQGRRQPDQKPRHLPGIARNGVDGGVGKRVSTYCQRLQEGGLP